MFVDREETEEIRVLATDPRVYYAPEGQWRSKKSTVYQLTYYAGASAFFSFEGSSISYISDVNFDHGRFAVSLDGESTSINSSYYNYLLDQQQLFTASVTPGRHNITIVNLDEGKAVGVEYFRYTPAPPTSLSLPPSSADFTTPSSSSGKPTSTQPSSPTSTQSSSSSTASNASIRVIVSVALGFIIIIAVGIICIILYQCRTRRASRSSCPELSSDTQPWPFGFSVLDPRFGVDTGTLPPDVKHESQERRLKMERLG